MANSKRPKKRRTKSLKPPFPYIQILTSLLIVLLGSGLLIFSSFKNIDWVTKPPQVPESQLQEDIAFTKPKTVYIPAMAEILSVSDGYVEGDRWSTSQIGVSYYISSAIPGQGNTVIYGHNIKGILGGLWRVQEGDYIYVVLTNGDFVKYQVFERKEIEPTQVRILDRTNDSRLTLYTCSGFLDTARFVVVAREVEKVS